MSGTEVQNTGKNPLVKEDSFDAKAIFEEGEVDKVIDFVRAEAAKLTADADMSTAKGRKAIVSAAYRVTRSKTLMEDVGKAHAADMKAKVSKIDKNRKDLRDKLEELAVEIRKPVTELEEAEQKRADEIEASIRSLIDEGQFTGTSTEISEVLADVKAVDITEDVFGDRQGDAAVQKGIAVSNLERALAKAVQDEKDAAELEELRREREAREAEEAERAEQQRIDDEEAQQRVEAAEKEAADARAAQERAEQAQKDAEAKAEREHQEREAEEQRQREEDERRTADKEHRQRINAAAAIQLMDWAELTEEQAGTVITVIAAGRIPGVVIQY